MIDPGFEPRQSCSRALAFDHLPMFTLLCILFIYSFLKNNFIYFFFVCPGSSLLYTGFLSLRWAGATLCFCALASHCSGFSCYRTQALGTWASAVAAWRLSSCDSQGLEHRLSSCALWHVESFLDQSWNLCPLHCWQILIYCTTRKVLLYILNAFAQPPWLCLWLWCLGA